MSPASPAHWDPWMSLQLLAETLTLPVIEEHRKEAGREISKFNWAPCSGRMFGPFARKPPDLYPPTRMQGPWPLLVPVAPCQNQDPQPCAALPCPGEEEVLTHQAQGMRECGPG